MALILDGRKLAADIKEEVKSEVIKLRDRGIMPKLTVILIGNDPASLIYVRMKQKECDLAGIDFELITLPESTPQAEIIAIIYELNGNPAVHGIMVELPLPASINKHNVFEAITPEKDVDGVNPFNRGYLFGGREGLFPATPQSCLEIMLRNGVEIEGKHAVLVGRGETVGRPLILMMLSQNATVTVCHTKTRDIAFHTRQADILIAAAGQAGIITGDMIRSGAIVIDAGINEAEGGKICGDVDFERAKDVAGAISPVPGGVGSLTTALLLKNILKAINISGLTR